jgi:sulfatase maturation enzyme AslB (radical SAM superfamily)
MISDPKHNTICLLPFNTLSVGSTGHQRLCCNSNNGLNGLDKPLPVTERSDIDWLDGIALQRIRKSLLNNERIPECNRCWEFEDIGQQSYRQMSVNIYTEYAPKRYDKILLGAHDPVIEKLEIDLGNKCNLACRMCGSHSSSLFAEEYNKVFNNSITVTPNSWLSDSRFFDLVRANASTLQHIHILGGEPLIIPEQAELLELLIELDIAKNIKLQYNTNITTIGNRWYETWNKFKFVEINASIDGTEGFYEYVRWPAKWDKIYNNLKELKLWASENPERRQMAAHQTLSNLTMPNVERSVELICQALSVELMYINVDDPESLSPWVLPSSVRQTFAKNAMNIYSDRRNSKYISPSTLHTFEKIFKSDEPPVEIQQAFIKRMKYMDENRKQCLLDLHPWFEEWYNAY